MPTTKAAKKALKVSEKKRSRNRRYNELTKESVKSLEALVSAEKKDTKKIAEALSSVFPVLTLSRKRISSTEIPQHVAKQASQRW
jgi:ribosomal protein S20